MTRQAENSHFQHELRTIYVALSENLTDGKILQMRPKQKKLFYRFIMTVDEDLNGAIDEMMKSKWSELSFQLLHF